jgi:uncharacterized protein (TIGR03435 family)
MAGPMLQALLEDRFKLKIRRATKDAPAYALMPAKHGLKLEPTKEGSRCVDPDLQRSSSLEVPPNRPDESICGNVYVNATGSNLIMEGHGVAGVVFAKTLSHYVDQPVVDKTGFAGRFDIRLEFSREEVADATAPSLYDALEQQLGLRLVADRAPSEYLIVEHVEKLSGSER